MASLNIRSVGALWNLAFRFVLHLLMLPWARFSGRVSVEETFAPDGVRSVRQDERDSAAAARRCTACGRCDALVATGMAPSLLIPRLARENADAPFARAALGPLRDEAERITAICPERVDVRALLLLVDRVAP